MALDIASILPTPPHLPEQSRAPKAAATTGASVVSAEATARPQAEQPSPAELQKTIAQLEQVSAAFNRRLSFSVNEKLGTVIVKVVDSRTDKVVREIPPAELQHVYERIREVVGLLFDEQA
jgi:flagellar protein FlaG